MSRLIQALVGQFVVLNSSEIGRVDKDSGVLEAFDGRVIRLRKGQERLYFPLHHVQGIMRATEAAPTDRRPVTDGPDILLRELMGQEIRVYPVPKVHLWTDGMLEDADEDTACVRTKDGSTHGLEYLSYLPLTRNRLIKPNR